MYETRSLVGQWEFALDLDGTGEKKGWENGRFDDTIALPGSVDEAKKAPFNHAKERWHLTRRHPYVGAAWYARDLEIEEDGGYHTLCLERVHGELTVWLDGYLVGRDDSLSTENKIFLGSLDKGSHRLVMRIDNSKFESVGNAIIRENAAMHDVAHSTTDHTQTNWNGIIGQLKLETTVGRVSRLAIRADSHDAKLDCDLEAFDPDICFPKFWTEEHRDEVRVDIAFGDGTPPLSLVQEVKIESALTPVAINLALPKEAGLWDEFDPRIHRATVSWLRNGQVIAKSSTDFGIRQIVRAGRHIKLNGRRIQLRGTLDCAIFPKTGYPPTDVEEWLDIFLRLKTYGLNHVRFHSWCPPRAAFVAGDQSGMLLQIEGPFWPILGADPMLDRYIHSESERIVEAYGNHPSFCFFCLGNEVHGDGLHAFLERWVGEWQKRDPRHLYTGGSGWPTTTRADYASKPEARSQRWDENLAGRLNARPLETRTDWTEWVQALPMPLISHEIGQWCVYPNFEEIADFDGVLAARNLELIRDDLAAKGRGELAAAMHMASGALQTQLYKEDCEATLRTPDMAGTQLLGIQDFPGQGTALIGVADAFWRPKAYCAPEEFRAFFGPVVPLLRTDGFVLTPEDRFVGDVQISHFGSEDISSPVDWTLIGPDGPCRSGRFETDPLITGHLYDIGSISIDLEGLPCPAAYELIIEIEGSDICNRWSIWLLPDKAERLPEIVSDLDETVLDRVAAGDVIVFQPDPNSFKPNAALGHSCAFWNTEWTHGQKPHTLGLLIEKDDPMLGDLPHDSHSDWHLWDLTFARTPLDLEGLDARVIIRVIDDWNQNRDLALLAEVAIGKGRLLLSAIDLSSADRPVSACLANALASYSTASSIPDVPSQTVAEVADWWKGQSIL